MWKSSNSIKSSIRVALVICVVLSCEPRNFRIPTPSMEATIPVGSRVLILDESPQRNDVVVFIHPFDHETYYLSRMVAVPGDSFRIKDSKIFVNGLQVKDPATIQHRYLLKTTMSLRDRFFEENKISVFFQTSAGYIVFITSEQAQKLKELKLIQSISRIKEEPETIDSRLYEDFHNGNAHYIRSIYLPKQGDRITGKDLMKYAQTIQDHEGVDVTSLSEYVFKNSYCFVMGDSRDNAEDSRYIGLIPMQNLKGKGTVWYKP